MAPSQKIETLKSSSIPTSATNKEEESSFDHAIQVVLSSVMSMSMRSAIDLGLFDIISKAGTDARLSASDIAAKMGTTNPEAPIMLERILSLLTAHSVLSCYVVSGQRFYSLNPVSKHFVANEDGASLGPVMTLYEGKVFKNSWSQVKDAVIEGGNPFKRTHGKYIFEYANSDPEFNQNFNLGMLNFTNMYMRKVLNNYHGFEHLTKLVDVGGGLGVALSLIISKYPHIKGINYDLPHVIKHAPHYPGVEHIGGDMFSYVPSGDAIFMKGIVHGCTDEECITLLKNCYAATPDNGKVIVVEPLIPVEANTSTANKISTGFDILMMAQTPGGRDRTQHEYMDLAKSTGFSGIQYGYLSNVICVMEFTK